MNSTAPHYTEQHVTTQVSAWLYKNSHDHTLLHSPASECNDFPALHMPPQDYVCMPEQDWRWLHMYAWTGVVMHEPDCILL